MKQLPLPIRLDQRASFDNFIVGDNRQALTALRHLSSPDGEPQVYLWGSEPVGKSHLLQGLCLHAVKLGMPAMLLPLSSFGSHDHAVLENLERYSIVCLDDIDHVCGLTGWAEALFHLINRLRQQGTRLVLTAHAPPDGLETPLPDLASRLAWGPVFRLSPLRDDDLIRFVIRRGEGQGVTIPPEVVDYLIKFTRRDVMAMIEWVDRLDREALAQQRRVTVPFVRTLVTSSAGRRHPGH